MASAFAPRSGHGHDRTARGIDGGRPLEPLRSHAVAAHPHGPPPGLATEEGLSKLAGRDERLYELVDGVLVAKTRGYRKSYLAILLATLLGAYVRRQNAGIVTGPDGTFRLAPGQVRIPDVAFASWERLPGGRLPHESLPDLAPDLAVEVLSRSNTPQEMERKLRDYFAAGVRLVRYVDPAARTANVYTEPDRLTVLREGDTLDGGSVLPGFSMAVQDLFAEPRPPHAGSPPAGERS